MTKIAKCQKFSFLSMLEGTEKREDSIRCRLLILQRLGRSDWHELEPVMRMIRPKAKALANLMAKAERRFERNLFARIAGRLSNNHRARIDALLEAAAGFSPFAEVSRSSGAASVENVLRTVTRLDTVCAVSLDQTILEDVHPDIIERFRLRAGTEDAWDMRRHPEETRYALLCCFLIPRAAELTDELGDLLISITHKIGTLCSCVTWPITQGERN